MKHKIIKFIPGVIILLLFFSINYLMVYPPADPEFWVKILTPAAPYILFVSSVILILPLSSKLVGGILNISGAVLPERTEMILRVIPAILFSIFFGVVLIRNPSLRTPQKPPSTPSPTTQVKDLPNKEPAKAVTLPRKTISQNSRQNEPASNDTSPKSNQFVDQCAKLDASLAIGVTTTEFRHMLIELAALQRKSNDTSRAKQVVSDYESVLHFLSLSSGQKLPGGECRLQLDSRGNLPKYLYKLDALGGDNWKEYRELQEALLRIVPTKQYLVTRKRREKDYEDKPVIGYYISKDAAFLIAKEAKKIWEQM